MIRRMLDILVCPFDKESELELYEFTTRNLEGKEMKIGIEPKSENLELDESIKNKRQISNTNPISISDVTKGGEKNKNEITSNGHTYHDLVIEEGILFCNSCFRFYPIVEEIPIILPDELRDKNKDLELLKKWSKSLPEKIVKKALPWHL